MKTYNIALLPADGIGPGAAVVRSVAKVGGGDPPRIVSARMAKRLPPPTPFVRQDFRNSRKK